MPQFLIVLPLPASFAPSVERFLRAGEAFLQALGEVTRHDLGTFSRSTRNGEDVVHLVLLSSAGAEPQACLSRARSLEVVLRSALAEAKAPTSDVRVFARTEVSAPFSADSAVAVTAR